MVAGGAWAGHVRSDHSFSPWQGAPKHGGHSPCCGRQVHGVQALRFFPCLAHAQVPRKGVFRGPGCTGAVITERLQNCSHGRLRRPFYSLCRERQVHGVQTLRFFPCLAHAQVPRKRVFRVPGCTDAVITEGSRVHNFKLTALLTLLWA